MCASTLQDVLLANIDNIVVISTMRTSRLERMIPMLSPVQNIVYVFDAIRGSDVDIDSLRQQGIYAPVNDWNLLTQGQLGCFLSHVQLWQYVARTNKTILVLEDDATLNLESTEHGDELRKCMEFLDVRMNLLFLGRNTLMKTDRVSVNNLVSIPGRSWGLFGYILTRTGAVQLLRRFQKDGMSVPCDIFVTASRLKGMFAMHRSIVEVFDDGISETLELMYDKASGKNVPIVR